jgi:hypothetical protein
LAPLCKQGWCASDEDSSSKPLSHATALPVWHGHGDSYRYRPRPWISQSAFTMAVQAYRVVPSSSLPVVVQKLPVVSLVTITPVQVAFACWVAWSLASLIAELLSDSVALPVPYTQTRTVIAPANMTIESTTGSTKSLLRIELSPFL